MFFLLILGAALAGSSVASDAYFPGGLEFLAAICWLMTVALLRSRHAPGWRQLGKWLPLRGRWLCYLVVVPFVVAAVCLSAAAVLMASFRFSHHAGWGI
jgi:hypothetical protein